MVDNESVEEICNRIREDGRREVESIIEKAERTASEIVAGGEKEREGVVEEIMSKARDRGEIERRRLLSGVNIEMRRERLKVREEVISNIMENVEKNLAKVREGGEYAGILEGLVIEGVHALEGGSFFASVDGRDAGLMKEKVAPAVREAVKKETGSAIDIEVRKLDGASLGGARVGIPGGKVIYDNTFEARMYRLRDDIRNIIFDEVFQSEGSEESGSA